MRMLFFIFCLTVWVNLNAQDNKVYKFRAFETRAQLNDTLALTNWRSVDFLVVLDIKKKRVIIYDDKENGFDIVRQYKDSIDKFGNFFMKFDAIDDGGGKCIVKINLFNSRIDNILGQLFIDNGLLTRIYKMN